MRNHASLFFTLAALLAVGLTGCGSDGNNEAIVTSPPPDTTPPTVTIEPVGDILGKTETITLTFSEPMDTDAILEGSLAEEAVAEWSQDNTILALTPKAADGEWTSGPDRTLSVVATDIAGNAADPLDATYLVVKLVFENFQAADVVIGQPDMTSSGAGLGDSQIGGRPYGRAAFGEGRLYISDYPNDRVLGFNAIPTTNGASADFVVGQPDFITGNGGISETAINGPESVAVHDGKLLVTEYANNRISIYQPLPNPDQNSAPGTIAVVVGQADFISKVNICDAVHLSNAEDAIVTPDGKLIVTDSGHNRVLVWNTLPAGNGIAADMVLGQQDFDTCDHNDQDGDGEEEDGPAANTMNFPVGAWSDGTRLAVVDGNNNRVLLWNTFPTSSGQPADIVLGQKTFALNAVNDPDGDGDVDGPAANTLNSPYNGVSSNGEQLFVADSGNNRVLIWNSWPTSNQQPADVVLGQADFTLQTGNNDDADDTTAEDGPTARTLGFPDGIHIVGDQLIVTDNSRYLVYTSK